MKQMIKKAVAYVWEIAKEEIFGQIDKRFDALEKRFDSLENNVKRRHEHDADALECDLASLDDQICQQIEKCRLRGYTTQSDRRRVTRMHEAYRARGGNHGEENEFEVFKRLPTEEEFFRMKGE